MLATKKVVFDHLINFEPIGGNQLCYIKVEFRNKISIKMFQIHQRIFCEYSRNFRRLPTYGFAHAKVKKSIFNSKILELVRNIGIIMNDF